MDLWIRSQNKDYLIKATDLYIPISRTNEDFSIYTICSDFRLGTYKTKERALEVLDEIQKIISPRGIVKQCKKGIEIDIHNMPIVYIMPEE